MEKKIKEKIAEIESTYDVDVLEARDFGSRAWKLHHENSDYDVAIVFKQPVEDYVGIRTYIETIDKHFQDGDIQFMGWNIKKFVRMLNQSNPSVMEFLASDLVYYSDDKADFSKFEGHMMENFNPVRLYHHYRELVKSQYERYLEDRNKPTVKKNLYVHRGMLYMRYIEETHEFPPLNFNKFLDEAEEIEELNDNLINDTRVLVEFKKEDKNKEVGVPSEEKVRHHVEKIIEPKKHLGQEPDEDKLNEILLGVFDE